jgi:hypothetical protein
LPLTLKISKHQLGGCYKIPNQYSALSLDNMMFSWFQAHYIVVFCRVILIIYYFAVIHGYKAIKNELNLT